MTKKTESKTAKPAFKVLEGKPAIMAAIKSVSVRGKTLERDMHIAAVSCLVHADKHGDITLANSLIDAIPNTVRKNALRDWFQAFGKFSYDKDAKALTYNKKAVTLVTEAIAMPFWEFKPEQEYKPFDINAAIQQVLNRAEKAIEKGEKLPSDKLATLRSLVVTEPSH